MLSTRSPWVLPLLAAQGKNLWDAADVFATIRAVISTAPKQGWNLRHTLMAPPQQMVAELQP